MSNNDNIKIYFEAFNGVKRQLLTLRGNYLCFALFDLLCFTSAFCFNEFSQAACVLICDQLACHLKKLFSQQNDCT